MMTNPASCPVNEDPVLNRPITPDESLNAGVAYRLLKQGETILEGDEHRIHSVWSPVKFTVGVRVELWDVGGFRRLDPGEGYRLVGEDELLRHGDETYLKVLGQWMPIRRSVGRTPREVNSWRHSFAPDAARAVYRRKLPAAPDCRPPDCCPPGCDCREVEAYHGELKALREFHALTKASTSRRE